MSGASTGMDAGTSGVRILQGRMVKGLFRLSRFAAAPVEGALEPAQVLGDLVAEADIRGSGARVGVSGREVIFRYTNVPPVPDWQLRTLMDFEVQEIADQSGGAIASDYNLLPAAAEMAEEETVLLALARTTLLDGLMESLGETRTGLGCFTPSAVALYNAFLAFADDTNGTVLLADVGEANLDLALVRNGELLFARNVAGGGSLFTEAVMERFNAPRAKARKAKERLGDLTPGAVHTEPNAEKVARALTGPAGQILSLLQTTLSFARSQVRLTSLQLDRVVLCGGAARLHGLDRYLASSMGVPVDRFDPFDAVDLSGLPEDEADRLDENRLESVVALGLAVQGADPALYGIEILPDAIRAKRDLVERHAWTGAAGLLLAGYLAANAWLLADRAAVVEKASGLAHAQNTRRSRDDKETRRLLDRSRDLYERTAALETRLGVGDSLGAVLSLLRSRMPEDLWVTRIHVERTTDDSGDLHTGGEVRPLVRVEGMGREGGERLSDVLSQFTEELRLVIPAPASLRQESSWKDGRLTFTLVLNLLPVAGTEEG